MTTQIKNDILLNVKEKEILDTFFEQNPEVVIAFYKLMYEKIKVDGFFNLELFINSSAGFNKDYYKEKLTNSIFNILYDKPYPKNVDELSSFWKENLNNNIEDKNRLMALKDFQKVVINNIDEIKKQDIKMSEYNNFSFFDSIHNLSYKVDQDKIQVIYLIKSISEIEAESIVNWIFKHLSNIDEREKFVINYLKNILSEYFLIDFDYLLKESYIIYNPKKVTIKIIRSLNSLVNYLYESSTSNLFSQNLDSKRLYFRGHSNANYKIIPGIYRDFQIEKNESKICNLLKIESPETFKECKTHLDEIAIMQHYGISTRILDITSNILVALFFACDNKKTHGEFIVFDIPDSLVKFNRDYDVTLLASLSALEYKYKQDIVDSSLTRIDEIEAGRRLIHEVKLENPSWDDEILKDNLFKVVFVSPEKRTPRIVRQSGAFFLFGLYSKYEMRNPANDCKLKDNEGKTVIFIIDRSNKNDIIKQLDRFNINNASLFPEVENIAKHIMKSYQSML